MKITEDMTAAINAAAPTHPTAEFGRMLEGASVGSKQTQNIVYPCDSWAKSAGFDSWQAALSAMNDAHVLTGSMYAVSPGTKSMLGLQLFMEMVNKNGLHTFATEDGSVIVGHKANFPADILNAQERVESEMAERFSFPTY
jgi:hypothetical protein